MTVELAKGKMNPEVKALWLEALRSGDYAQGKGYLCQVDEYGERKYCCLGVLMDIAERRGIIDPAQASLEGHMGWLDSSHGGIASAYLSNEAQKWAGLSSNEGHRSTPNEWRSSLAELNDIGTTFAEIADTIEAEF